MPQSKRTYGFPKNEKERQKNAKMKDREMATITVG